jgi:hypothetical protein
MKSIPTGGSYNHPTDIRQLEAYLGASLKPVQPRPEFVFNSREKLADYSSAQGRLLSSVRYVLIFILGAFSSAVIVIAGVRALRALIGANRLSRRSNLNALVS